MINPQMIMQLQQMAQQGAQIKDILFMLKSKNLSADNIENLLCEAFPQIKQAKQAITNSGLSTQQYLNQLAKQNNIPTDQLNGMINNFKKMLG